MERMTHKRANGIKTGYWSPETKETLVQRLAAYENTGLEPWEIGPAIEKAAKDAETATATKMAECIAGDKYDELLNVMIPDDDPGVLVPHEVGDGGLLLMPTRANIPDPQRDDWKPTTCPICGAECWETEIHRQALAAEPGLRAVCTDCGLRGAAGVGLVNTGNKEEEKDHE